MRAPDTGDAGAPRPGMLLGGKYVVERVLGVGGMAAVVSARHAQIDQRVAIKYLLPAAASMPQAAERFVREARAAARVCGTHVVRVLDSLSLAVERGVREPQLEPEGRRTQLGLRAEEPRPPDSRRARPPVTASGDEYDELIGRRRKGRQLDVAADRESSTS